MRQPNVPSWGRLANEGRGLSAPATGKPRAGRGRRGGAGPGPPGAGPRAVVPLGRGQWGSPAWLCCPLPVRSVASQDTGSASWQVGLAPRISRPCPALPVVVGRPAILLGPSAPSIPYDWRPASRQPGARVRPRLGRAAEGRRCPPRGGHGCGAAVQDVVGGEAGSPLTCEPAQSRAFRGAPGSCLGLPRRRPRLQGAGPGLAAALIGPGARRTRRLLAGASGCPPAA